MYSCVKNIDHPHPHLLPFDFLFEISVIRIAEIFERERDGGGNSLKRTYVKEGGRGVHVKRTGTKNGMKKNVDEAKRIVKTAANVIREEIRNENS